MHVIAESSISGCGLVLRSEDGIIQISGIAAVAEVIGRDHPAVLHAIEETARSRAGQASEARALRAILDDA